MVQSVSRFLARQWGAARLGGARSGWRGASNRPQPRTSVYVGGLVIAVMSVLMATIPKPAGALPGPPQSRIAAGLNHSLFLRSDGTIQAWGSNDNGKLGDGTTTDRSTPVPVSGIWDVTAVAAGDASQSLALRTGGAVWDWGYWSSGRTDVPAAVPGLSGVVAIAAGSNSLALKVDRTLWVWGLNGNGEMGDGTIFTHRSSPTQVPGLSDIVAMDGGAGHVLAVKADGTVRAWGSNGQGQLGNGTTSVGGCVCVTTPVQVSGLTGVVAVSGGIGHSLALKGDGTVWAWGDNSDGQLGNGTTANSSTPVAVPGLAGVSAIAAGREHSLALMSNGTVRAWGSNGAGALGNGTTSNSSTPVTVSGLSGVSAISGGNFHYSLSLKADQSAWGWGDNSDGQLGDGTTTSRYTPVVAHTEGDPPTVTDPNDTPDATCTGADTDKTTGDENASASEGCMDMGTMSYDSSDYEVRRAQGGVGGATPALNVDGTAATAAESGAIAGRKCTDDPPLPRNFGSNIRQTRVGCMLLRELDDIEPAKKSYSQELYVYAKANVNYTLARVKVRSWNKSPGVSWFRVDPGSDYDVADGGSQSTNWSFGYSVKGLSAGVNTTTTKPTHSGRIHPYPFNRQLYHVSWMSKSRSQRLPAGIAQEAIGSVMWTLPEGPQPLATDLVVQVWTCPAITKYVDQRCTQS